MATSSFKESFAYHAGLLGSAHEISFPLLFRFSIDQGVVSSGNGLHPFVHGGRMAKKENGRLCLPRRAWAQRGSRNALPTHRPGRKNP